MEKNIGFAGGSTQPVSPLPSAPPSYEEAVENAARMPPRQPVIPPYPLGSTSMPIPVHTPPTTLPTLPYPTTYPGAGEPSTQPQPQYNANPSAVVQTEVRVIPQSVIYCLGPNPTKLTCPTCHASIKTSTISDQQPSAHLCCIILCLLGCCLCSCLPYCMNNFMSVHHFCPKCKSYIGTWKG